MSFRAGAAVTGAALAVVGTVIALAVMLTGHGAAATGAPPGRGRPPGRTAESAEVDAG